MLPNNNSASFSVKDKDVSITQKYWNSAITYEEHIKTNAKLYAKYSSGEGCATGDRLPVTPAKISINNHFTDEQSHH
jgi:hypothetical protein